MSTNDYNSISNSPQRYLFHYLDLACTHTSERIGFTFVSRAQCTLHVVYPSCNVHTRNFAYIIKLIKQTNSDLPEVLFVDFWWRYRVISLFLEGVNRGMEIRRSVLFYGPDLSIRRYFR